MTTRRFDLALIALASLILVVASTYHLRESPAIWYDEGYYTQAAMNMAQHGFQALQVAPGQFVSTAYVTVGYPLLAPLALSYKLFGVGVLQGRAVMVLFILLLAAVSFFLIRALYGLRSAALSVLLLASFAMLYGNGKPVLGEVPGLFYLVASLWALVALERGQWKNLWLYSLAGLLIGLTAATKPIYALFPIAVLIALVWQARSLPVSLRGVCIALAGAILPILLWIHLQFGSGVSLHSILSAYVNPYEVSNVWVLILGNIRRFFTELTPLYTFVLLAVWSAALYLSRRRLSFAERAAYLFALLTTLDYLRISEWYRYLFPATLIALLFFAPSAFAVYDALAARSTLLRRARYLPIALLLALSGLQLYQTAFSSYVAGYYASTKVDDVQASLASAPPRSSFFLYDVPELAVLLPTGDYYQYLHPHPDLEFGQGELAVLAAGTPDIVIVGSDTYAADPSSFARYKILSEPNQYIILQRR